MQFPARFPLTLALSLREREERSTLGHGSPIGEHIAALRLILPLLGERAGVREDVASQINFCGFKFMTT
jgi:hypothetical protein